MHGQELPSSPSIEHFSKLVAIARAHTFKLYVVLRRDALTASLHNDKKVEVRYKLHASAI